jgi:hypothetical protein
MKGFEKMANDAGESNTLRIQLEMSEMNELNEIEPPGEEAILLMHAHDILDEDGVKVDQFSTFTYTAYRFFSLHGMSVYVRLDKANEKGFQHRIFIISEETKFSLTSYDGDDVKAQIEAIYEKARNLCARKINAAYERRLRMARKDA